MDTSELEAAYRSFLDVARAGGFKPPSDRKEWSAELVLAHVAANDRLLAAATAAVLDGEPASYDNSAANSEAYLEAVARAAGDWDGLVAEVRRCGLELVLLARRLDEQQATTAVATRIVDGGEVRVDAPMPWSGVLVTQAQVHLPDHQAQLAGLR
jgi:hypothetical protein